MSTPDPAWRVKRTPCPFYQSGRCIFNHKCNFIHDGDINMRRSDIRAHVPVYRRTPENSVDSFSSSDDDERVQEHTIDEHSAAAPSLVFSSIYGPRPNSINRLQLANVDLPVSPESLPHTPPRTSRPASHHSVHNHVSITSPTPSRPLSSSLGIGIGGRAQGGLAEVFAAIANTQAQAQSTALPPSSAGSLPSPLSLSPKSPALSPKSPVDVVQEIIVKNEGYSLEQLPFKLALSNQSSLLLNRTSRAAQRRSSSLSQRQDTSSSSGVDREKRPTNLSVPERLSISSLPRHPGDRPISVSTVAHVDEEEQADDEQDEEEQEIVDESPSFEALQPYPRDVSNEPSPDPTRQGFIPPAPALPPPTQQPPKVHTRNDSARHVDHEMVIDELEERFGVDPTRRRRARSNAVPNPGPSATSPNRSTSQPTGKKADAIWERKPPIQLPKSNVDMGAARDMLGAMFAKRDQQLEEKVEEHSSDEHSFLPVDWDIGSMAGLDEEDQVGEQEVPVAPEPALVRQEITTVGRESVNARRKSTAPQSRASIPIPRPTPIPASQLDEHPQTPTTASTIPETPNTQITHSTQPTPPSDHAFDETDTEDEHPEDLADLIEAEPIVLSTPRSVVLRREVGRETSLPSRTGTGTATPGVWTPRPGSGAWTPRHGSVVSGSGGLQVIESPTIERRQHERRQSLQPSHSSPSESRRSPSERSSHRIEDITESTISDVTLDTVGGQTEDMSPVSRPVVSDRALVSAPVVSSAPILGSVSPLGNGLGSVPSTPSELDSSNGLGSGVQASDIVSPSTPISSSSPVPYSGNISGLGAGSGLGSISPASSGASSGLVGSGPILQVASEKVPQAVVPIVPSPISPTPELPVAPASVLSAEPFLEAAATPSTPVSPHPVTSTSNLSSVRNVVPESVLPAASRPTPRAEPDLPVSKAKTPARQKDSGSIPSAKSSPPPPPSSEPNHTARANPSLVAGPDSKGDHPISRPLDRGSASIPGRSSKSNGVPVEPIRDTPHAGRDNLDSERVVLGSNDDMVERHVPEQGGPSGGERKDSGKFVEDLHGDVVQGSGKRDTVREVAKEMSEVAVESEGRVQASSTGSVNGKSTDNIAKPHEDLRGAVHQSLQHERVEERPQATSTIIHRDTVGSSKVEDRGTQKQQQDVRQELSRTINADIGKAVVEPVIRGGDLGARALVSDSEPKSARDAIPTPTNSSPKGLASALSDNGTQPAISQAPVAEESTEKAALDTPEADEVVVVQASLPSAEQMPLGEAIRAKEQEQSRRAVDVGVERDGADLGGRGLQEDKSAGEGFKHGDLLSEPIGTSLDIGGSGGLGASSKDNDSTTQEAASKDGHEERGAPKTSTNPLRSELPSPAPVSQSAPTGNETALEPDHIDSLSELEESFGVRSPIMDKPSTKPALSRPVAPSPPAILVPAQALDSAPPIPEQSPMLPPLAPLPPLSPILPFSSSVTPSPPTSSSPPTTPSLPESHSPAVSFVSSTPPSVPEPRAIPSEDGPVIKRDAPVSPEPPTYSVPLEPEQPLSPAPVSETQLSVQEETLDTPKASSPSSLPNPQPSEHRSTPEALPLPESPLLGPLPSREPISPEQVGLDLPSPHDDTAESKIIPASPSLESKPVSREEEPSVFIRPESPKSSSEPPASYKSAAPPQSSLPLDLSPLPGAPEADGALPSPSIAEEYSPPLKRSSLPRPLVVDEPAPLPVAPSVEPSQLHTPSPSPSPEAGPSSLRPSQPNPSSSLPPTFDGPLPLSELASSAEISQPAALPESPKLPESIPLPNSPLLPNTFSHDVSLPLEPLSPPRSPLLDSHTSPEPVLPEPSPLLSSSSLHEPSSLISPPLFEPSPWPGLSVSPKPPPTSSPVSSPHGPLPLSDHDSPGSSHPGPLPELPPTEDLQRPGQPTEPASSEAQHLDASQEHGKLPVTPDRRHIRGSPDPLSPWGSLRFRRSPGAHRSLDDEQPLPKSSLLFDYASLPTDSPPGSRTPLTRLPPLPEDSLLLEYPPLAERVQPGEYEGLEGDRLPEYVAPLEDSVGTFAVLSERLATSRSRSPVDSQLSQRSSLSEIPSLSDIAPLPARSDTAPQQYVRTATLASEPRAASEPSSKPRPRSQLKPLRLSLLHGLGSTSPGTIITPVTANTIVPSPGLRSEAVTPTPTAMYPTPSSAHPTHQPAALRSDSQPSTEEQTTEANAIPGPVRELNGLDSVSWFGAKKGIKRGTLSAARQSNRGSVQGSNRSSGLHDATVVSPERATMSAMEQSPPHPPITSADDEDVRPLPMIWDDETEAGSKAGSSRQGTQSSTQSRSHVVPVLEAFPPDTAPVDMAPPLKTPDRLDTTPRYPTFVNVGVSSPRISDGRSPLSSPRAVSEHVSEPSEVQQPEDEPADTRSRKWADTVNQDSIGSLPDFNAPAPSKQMSDGQPSESKEPHTPAKRKDRRHYMKIPNTAPLSISPRRVSPSIMQRSQDSIGSYGQDASSQDEMKPYDMPRTAPLDLRTRILANEGTNGPWMAEYFTNSPSSFHGSQLGSMHSASSSLSTGARAADIRRSISSHKQTNGPVHVEDGTFGNPGPGPSTMKTFSERRQSAEALRSPIALRSPSPEPVPSVTKTPQEPTSTLAKRRSSQLTLASIDVTPRKAQDALQLKVSSADSVPEIETSIYPSTSSAVAQPIVRNEAIVVSPTEQRTPYKALSLSSPSPGRQPHTPSTAASPLQILRRNLMARTSPDSPRFLSPQTKFSNLPDARPFRHQHHASASLAPMTRTRDEFQNPPMSAPGPRDRRSLTPNTRFAATPSIPGSPAQSVHSTISQTKPLLFFAIAKNSAQEVEKLLQDGDVKPNDKAGPEDLPALAFTLANEQLSDKTQIVKSLLSHGADPSSVLHRNTGSGQFDDADLALTTRIEQGMNPAIRYYLNRKQMTIPAPQAELLEKNNFGGLTRAGFSIIGQDAALEELIRVVAGHCRRQALNPLVVVFSGGPGCGKSLLASKIGPLLHVPYFTVNMTNLRNEAALFNYISMTTKAGQPQIPLVDFLRNNQGQRCVVVLEEIEKAADKTVWHSLLMPWEWGKATVICSTTNEQIDIDTSQVIWIATSNSGDDATLKFFAERSRPSDRGESALVRLAHNPRSKEDNFTRKDYLQLMQAVRKRLGEILGSSMISRVSSVLPFLPFTEDEVYALASESLSAMRAEQKGDRSYDNVDWEELLQQAVGEYIPGEGARSVHRAVQRAFDEIEEW